jgi:hypothetical protein
MATFVTENAIWKGMKKTLSGITTEDLSKNQCCVGKNKICAITTMEDGYQDYMETAGTTFLPEKPTGQAMRTDTIIIGGTKRIMPRTMAKEVPIAEEAMEDCKYKEILDASKRLQASAYHTQDYDIASMPLGATTIIQGYDGVVLASAAHVLPTGQHASNCIGTAVDASTILTMSPSVQALWMARQMAAVMPGPNGIPDGKKLKRIVCPEAQVEMWKVILGTEKSPGNNYNDINVVAEYGLSVVPVKWFDMNGATTLWGIITDAEDGFMALQKRAIRGKIWVDNSCEVAHHGVSYRMGMGVPNWRAWINGST